MTNYEPFVAPIAASLQGKEKTAKSLSTPEIKAVLEAAFKESVHKVAVDTDGYHVRVPLDLFEGVKDYPIEPPAQFTFNGLVKAYENKAKLPPSAFVEDGVLRLPCCATNTIENAVTLQISVLPNPINAACEYDDAFVNKYYQAILTYMRYTLSMQPAREWASLGSADRLLVEYKKTIKRFRNEAFRGRITIRAEKLSDAANSNHTSTYAADQADTRGGCSTC